MLNMTWPVCFLYALEFAQSALLTADILHWFAIQLGDQASLSLSKPWYSSIDAPVLGGIIALIVQLFFCWRIWVSYFVLFERTVTYIWENRLCTDGGHSLYWLAWLVLELCKICHYWSYVGLAGWNYMCTGHRNYRKMICFSLSSLLTFNLADTTKRYFVHSPWQYHSLQNCERPLCFGCFITEHRGCRLGLHVAPWPILWSLWSWYIRWDMLHIHLYVDSCPTVGETTWGRPKSRRCRLSTSHNPYGCRNKRPDWYCRNPSCFRSIFS